MMGLDIPLQTSNDWLNLWLNGDWKQAILDPVTATIGDSLFAMFLGGGILFSLWLGGRGDLAAPISFLMLFSFILVPVLPASLHGLVWTLSFLGLASGLMSVGRRYVMEP